MKFTASSVIVEKSNQKPNVADEKNSTLENLISNEVFSENQYQVGIADKLSAADGIGNLNWSIISN